MATLSKSDSSWRGDGVRRRDARQDRSGPEITSAKKRHKKDTRTWCRGKVGVAHQVERTTPTYGPPTAKDCVCTVCGMTGWRLPAEARAQADPQLADQLDRANRLCSGGHDWTNKTLNTAAGPWPIKVCTNCGKVG